MFHHWVLSGLDPTPRAIRTGFEKRLGLFQSWYHTALSHSPVSAASFLYTSRTLLILELMVFLCTYFNMHVSNRDACRHLCEPIFSSCWDRKA